MELPPYLWSLWPGAIPVYVALELMVRTVSWESRMIDLLESNKCLCRIPFLVMEPASCANHNLKILTIFAVTSRSQTKFDPSGNPALLP